jgi:microcystin-dependent protein
MRFYTNDSRSATIRWYFVPEGTPHVPYPNAFMSRIWDEDHIGWDGLGEVYGATRTYDKGGSPPIVALPGAVPCGTADQWGGGQANPPTPPVQTDAFGNLLCCRAPGNHVQPAACGCPKAPDRPPFATGFCLTYNLNVPPASFISTPFTGDFEMNYNPNFFEFQGGPQWFWTSPVILSGTPPDNQWMWVANPSGNAPGACGVSVTLLHYVTSVGAWLYEVVGYQSSVVPWDGCGQATLYAFGWTPAPTWPTNLYFGPPMLYPGFLQIDSSNAMPPSGWLLCNGQAVSRLTYSALFARIGTMYGAGDGVSTFNLPDPRDFVLGVSGLRYTPGQKYGNDSPTLAANQLPAHTHPITDPGHQHGPQTNSFFTVYLGATSSHIGTGTLSVDFEGQTAVATTGITGTGNNSPSGNPLDVRQQSIAFNLLIYTGVFI